MKKVLVFCGSPYQILVAERVVAENYPDCQVDIIIADTIANSEELFERIKTQNFYSNVYYWKIKNRFKFSGLQKIINILGGWRASKKFFLGPEFLDKSYDVFLYSNISQTINHLGRVLMHNNPNMIVEMFEDGFSTYSNYTGSVMNSGSIKNQMQRDFILRTENLYVFREDTLEWMPKFRVTTIHPEFTGDGLRRINAMFGYDQLTDNYEKKVLFFEESYSGDGKDVDDVELVDTIAEIVGKENIMVKIHPRNPSNRFEQKGYATNKNLSIPWEVILLNQEFDKTTFVTIASNAAMNPFFLFGKKIPAVLLFKCTKTPDALYGPIIELDEKLCKKHPEVFFIPQKCEELTNYFRTRGHSK